MTSPSLTDVHAHFLTGHYVEAAVAAGHTTPDGMPAWPRWSADQHLSLMDATGIGRSLLSVSSPGVHFGDDAAARELARHVNDAAAEIVEARPDRFGHLVALPLPDVGAAVAEARRGLDELGADGVLLPSNAAGLYPGDRALDPLFDELDARGALVLVHPSAPPHADAVSRGRPLPMIEFLFDAARSAVDLVLADRIGRHPRIRWVLTHGGGVLPLLTARVNLFSLFDPQAPRQDVATALAGCWFDCAGTPLPVQLPAIAATVGGARLVYGSDHCFTPAPAVEAQIASLAAPGPTGTWRDHLATNTRALLHDDERNHRDR
ncbi:MULTISPECIES: amidohydrolase family protein [unclassified Pseudonocardia]|uniref:amidohydrolase family protein n=1 Tax=unclassified Pseudonocardia TaxID=2619320 RepID=UPI0001FFEF3E|nr:amidohydrolase family protein [Pseudonocardia sp. Ae707_Ps1]OLM17362.1 2-amino-3-carboxymuconate 6-semialdehyde decarboxylase [Pseudonocardia sp. Ae707_Ps1]